MPLDVSHARLVVSGDISIEYGQYTGIHSAESNGGSIFCEAEVDLNMTFTAIVDSSCISNGGGCFGRCCRCNFLCDKFQSCRTSNLGDNQGGNAIRIENALSKVEDSHFFYSWIDGDCGDSIIVFLGGIASTRLINVTESYDNKHGMVMSIYYKEDSTRYEYSTIYHCNVGCAHEDCNSNYMQYVSDSNIINNTLLYGHFWIENGKLTAERCCFFRNTKISYMGTPIYVDCFGDFNETGVTRTLETSNRLPLKKCETIIFTYKKLKRR